MWIFCGEALFSRPQQVFSVTVGDVYIVTTFWQVDTKISLELTVHHGSVLVHQLDLQVPFIEHSLKTYFKRKIFTLALPTSSLVVMIYSFRPHKQVTVYSDVGIIF